jgi:hypothetical protein
LLLKTFYCIREIKIRHSFKAKHQMITSFEVLECPFDGKREPKLVLQELRIQ